MTPRIDPSSVVDPAAKLGAGVRIGPFCTVGPEAELEDGVELVSHVVVEGRCRIGAGTRVFPFATLGMAPQDLKYRGEPSEVTIGRNCVLREQVTIHRGTRTGRMLTTVGDDCLLMVGVHVAHDCRIGNKVIMANLATCGGHVTIGDHAFLGGLSAVHQFCRVGDHAYVAGMTPIRRDVIPWGVATGDDGRLDGLNIIGMQRSGIGRAEIHTLLKLYRLLFSADGMMAGRVAQARSDFGDTPLATAILDFIAGADRRRILQPRGAVDDGEPD